MAARWESDALPTEHLLVPRTWKKHFTQPLSPRGGNKGGAELDQVRGGSSQSFREGSLGISWARRGD